MSVIQLTFIIQEIKFWRYDKFHSYTLFILISFLKFSSLSGISQFHTMIYFITLNVKLIKFLNFIMVWFEFSFVQKPGNRKPTFVKTSERSWCLDLYLKWSYTQINKLLYASYFYFCIADWYWIPNKSWFWMLLISITHVWYLIYSIFIHRNLSFNFWFLSKLTDMPRFELRKHFREREI